MLLQHRPMEQAEQVKRILGRGVELERRGFRAPRYGLPWKPVIVIEVIRDPHRDIAVVRIHVCVKSEARLFHVLPALVVEVSGPRDARAVPHPNQPRPPATVQRVGGLMYGARAKVVALGVSSRHAEHRPPSSHDVGVCPQVVESPT